MTLTNAPPPGHRDEATGLWRVTSYAAAEQVLRSPGWSSDPRNSTAFVEQFGNAEFLPGLLTSMLLFSDGEEHQRLRRLVAPAFAARRMEVFRARVGEIVDVGLAGLPRGQQFDVLSELTYPVTLAVICELLDTGTDGASVLLDETTRLAGLLEVLPTEAQLIDAADASLACMLLLLPLLDGRRTAPGDDFLSALQRETYGDRLSLEEALAATILLLTAGHETTANLIAHALLELLRHPDQWARLRREPDLVSSVIEETLRLHPPARLVGRIATSQHLVGELAIEPGEQIIVDLAAAGRDPARFSDPGTFDPGREDAGHLSFGAGPHFCLGSGLARIEAEETLRRTADAFPSLSLVESDPPYRESTTFHALDRLLVGEG